MGEFQYRKLGVCCDDADCVYNLHYDTNVFVCGGKNDCLVIYEGGKCAIRKSRPEVEKL